MKIAQQVAQQLHLNVRHLATWLLIKKEGVPLMISPSSRYKAYLIYSWFRSVSGSCVNHEKISFSRPDFVDSEIVT